MIDPRMAGACEEGRNRIGFVGVYRVTHEQDRPREAEFWATKSIAERVIAGWELVKDDLMRGERNEPEKRTGWTRRRISRSGR